MRSLALASMLLTCASLASAQTTPNPKSVAPLTQDQNDLKIAAELQIDLLNKQLAALSQLNAQYQRGLVVYPVALALPGPINCQGNCRQTVGDICRAIRYPNVYVYAAVVPADIVGTYVNGICYGP